VHSTVTSAYVYQQFLHEHTDVCHCSVLYCPVLHFQRFPQTVCKHRLMLTCMRRSSDRLLTNPFRSAYKTHINHAAEITAGIKGPTTDGRTDGRTKLMWMCVCTGRWTRQRCASSPTHQASWSPVSAGCSQWSSRARRQWPASARSTSAVVYTLRIRTRRA